MNTLQHHLPKRFFWGEHLRLEVCALLPLKRWWGCIGAALCITALERVVDGALVPEAQTYNA